MPTSVPRAPLPPVLVSTEEGTWAYDTMSRRVRHEILARVFRENSFPAGTLRRLRALDEELAAAGSTKLTPVPEDGGPDVETWNKIILPDVLRNGATWLSAPWAIAEFYLYRRLMSAIDYFSEPMDPFEMQKELGLTSSITSISTLAARVNEAVLLSSQETLPSDLEDTITALKGFVLTSLVGNKIDLSLFPVGGKGAPGERRSADAFAGLIEFGQRMILANDMDALAKHISDLAVPSAPRMDIIVDNAGFELFCDLCLADFLVSTGLASVVHIQLKAHPTFVSDAMAKDVFFTINFLRRGEGAGRGAKDSPFEFALSALGNRWASHVESGRWNLVENFFWVQPTAMWEMPEKTAQDLTYSSLVFVKGDANYRRLLGDRDWQFDTPFEDILCYFPAPVCALRTLKAEIGCGMTVESMRRAAEEDERWLVAGKYGVVQFLDTRNL